MTVTVYNQSPSPLFLTAADGGVISIPSIKGRARTITPGVPQDAWDAWAARNAAMVASNVVFAIPDAAPVEPVSETPAPVVTFVEPQE